LAVAVLFTWPASRSAWVMVWLPLPRQNPGTGMGWPAHRLSMPRAGSLIVTCGRDVAVLVATSV
jgi:hypothetical protein